MDDPVKILQEDKEKREPEEQRQKAEAELLEGSANILEFIKRRKALRYQVIEPDRATGRKD